MAKQYWLQYHSFERYGPPSFAGIDTNKDEFLSRMRWGQYQDIILLMVGLKPTENNLLECGLPLSIREQVSTDQRVYVLWEKFIAESYKYLGEKQFGGFDYSIFGNEKGCVDLRSRSIVFQSPEFEEFWTSYNRHGLICLSDHCVPFPELEKIDEGLIYRTRRVSQNSNLNISGKVPVSQDVWKGIEFIRQRLPKHQLAHLAEVCSTLKRYRYDATEDWIKKHPQEYLGGWKYGFEVQAEA